MHLFTKSRSIIDPTWWVKGDVLTSMPMAGRPASTSVRMSASPRCPALPVTRRAIAPRSSHGGRPASLANGSERQLDRQLHLPRVAHAGPEEAGEIEERGRGGRGAGVGVVY